MKGRVVIARGTTLLFQFHSRPVAAANSGTETALELDNGVTRRTLLYSGGPLQGEFGAFAVAGLAPTAGSLETERSYYSLS